MLGAIRKFSSSVYAKIFLFIVAIPFVFWGMGPLFRGGNLNTIVKIGNENISTQEFINFLQYRAPNSNDEALDSNLVEKLLSNFIGEKLISQEIEDLEIKISDDSLRKLIKNEKIFMRDNKFSRIEYEKFLVKNGLNATTLEANISKQEKKEQLLNFIGEGILPPKFLVNLVYDKINQKRNVEIIDLNNVFKQKLNFSEDQIESYFHQNKDMYKNIYKSIKFIKLSPKNLADTDEFNDLFFQKVDEIDDLIVEGKNLDFILNKFNLQPASSATFGKSDMYQNSETFNNFPTELIKKVFNISETEPTVILEQKNNYFIVELIKSENIQEKITNKSIRKEILLALKKHTKRKLISGIISKINNNTFKKYDFDKLSNDEKVVIKKVGIESQNDTKILKQELVEQIYAFPEKKIIVVADISLQESYLVYIDKIEKTSIEKNTEDYKKYFNLSKTRIATNLYNTYDSYLRKKYKIDINYNALDSVKNNLR